MHQRILNREPDKVFVAVCITFGSDAKLGYLIMLMTALYTLVLRHLVIQVLLHS